MARVFQDSKVKGWCLDYVNANGRRIRQAAGPTRTLAEAVLRQKLQEVAEEKAGLTRLKVEDKRLSEIIPEFVQWTAAHARPNTARFYNEQLKNFPRIWRDVYLSRIDRRKVDSYIAIRKAEGVKPATINRDLVSLKRLFNKAIEWRFALANPVKGVRLLKEQNERIRWLEPQEEKALLERCTGQLRDIVDVARLTGMRRGEVFGLTWADIDFQRGLVTLRETKGGRVRHFPLYGELREVFDRIPRMVGNPRLFAGSNGEPPVNFRRQWEAALKRSGVKDFRFHDLRHHFASLSVMSGMRIEALRDLLGHQTIQMTLRYAHLAPDYKRSELENLGRWRKEWEGGRGWERKAVEGASVVTVGA
jgi:integrase